MKGTERRGARRVSVSCQWGLGAFPGTSVNRDVFPGHIAYGAFVQSVHPFFLGRLIYLAHVRLDYPKFMMHGVGFPQPPNYRRRPNTCPRSRPARGASQRPACAISGSRVPTTARSLRASPSIDERSRTSSWCSWRGEAQSLGAPGTRRICLLRLVPFSLDISPTDGISPRPTAHRVSIVSFSARNYSKMPLISVSTN
jgi:hypothetical protein